MNRISSVLILAILACTCGNVALAVEVSSPDSSIVIVTQEGIVPVRTLGGRTPKNSDGTYFLRSAVEPVHKPTPPPKPATRPTPAPHLVKVQPKPTPAPKPAPTPLPKEEKKHLPSPSKTQTVKNTPVVTPQITVKKQTSPSSPSNHQVKNAISPDDDLDEYSDVARVADPIQPFNRTVFWMNHQLYRYILRPLSVTYDAVLPGSVRTGIYNVFDNLEYPVRFVNDSLQGKFKKAGLETEKFVVNSTAGVGGIMKVSSRIPSLADIPRTDTGTTLAKWGIPHGFYIVLPIFGPKSLRDTVGLGGDIALSPVTWVSFGALGGVGATTTLAVSAPDSARTLHEKLDTYDAATRDSMDRYVAVRSAYVQNRKQAEKK